MPKVSYPLQLVSVDLYSYKSQLYLTAVDHFSGFPVAYVVEDKTKEIVQATLELYVSDYGMPKAWLTDQGGEFVDIGILAVHLTTSAYHPQTNGKSGEAA